MEQSKENGTVSASQQLNQCVTLSNWVNAVKMFVFFDSLVTIIVPFLIIATMNSLIAWKLIMLNKHASNLFSIAGQQKAKVTAIILNIVSRTPRPSTTSIASQQKFQKLLRSTKILFLITFFFLVLNSPIAISKMRYAYQSIQILINPHVALEEYGTWDETIERVTCYMYYLNFATNFIFYF
jgi:hypothetical protein